MIPWVRSQFAERRAKWLAARSSKRVNGSNDSKDSASGSPIPIPASATQRTTQELNVTNQANITAGNLESRLIAGAALNETRVTNGISNSPISNKFNGSVSAATTPVHCKLPKLKHLRRNSSSSCQDSNTTIIGSDEAISGLPKEKIKVRIICPSARLLVFQTDKNKKIVELKNEIILELSDDPASMPHFATEVRQLSPRYRLLKAEYQGVELNEALTLVQHHIEDNDTLVLVARRNNLHQVSLQSRDTQAPREQDIETATRNIAPRTEDLPMVDINEIFQQSNLQFDVRKVLISLAQSSAAIIGSGPYANRLIAMLKQKLINKRSYQNDTLQCLIDMGFKKEKAEYALSIHHNVYASALEWLIARQSDDLRLEEEAAVGMQKSRSILSPSGILTDNSIIENTQALLEIVRIYSHREMPPTPETISALVEMGFEESEVLNALKKTCNNKAAACEWLCGNRSGSLIELRDGLAEDSPILKSILELPQVQMNLSNPKILLAFLSILENENSIRVWGGDSDTTSVITHILQKYHEEKHVLGINQFYGNR